MEWTLWIGGYLAIGVVLFILLWKAFHIVWEAEASDTKLLMIATPIAWPLVLLLVGVIWIVGIMKR